MIKPNYAKSFRFFVNTYIHKDFFIAKEIPPFSFNNLTLIM
jgi:hypothetical protein